MIRAKIYHNFSALEPMQFEENIEKITLENNSFVELQPELFTGLKRLNSMEIRSNDIRQSLTKVIAEMLHYNGSSSYYDKPK